MVFLLCVGRLPLAISRIVSRNRILCEAILTRACWNGAISSDTISNKNKILKFFQKSPVSPRGWALRYQRWPKSLFQTPTPLLFQNFWIRTGKFFKFENPTPVQTPNTIIDQTVIYQCFHLRNDHTNSCYCRHWKVTPDPVPAFHRFLTLDPGPKEKCRILPELTPAPRIQCYLCKVLTSTSGVSRGLSQGGQILAEGDPLVTVGGPLAKTQKKVKKWLWISGCRGCLY